ncbi:MAG: DUF4258 domain-containing protein [Planctomycetota bacterium]
MEIEIIPLASKKMFQRGISIEMVKETVEKPDQIVDGYMNRKVKQKIYYLSGKKKLLRVIGEDEGNKFVVITAYLTSKIEGYWRNEL